MKTSDAFPLIGEISYMTTGAELSLSQFYSLIEDNQSLFSLFNERIPIKEKITKLKASVDKYHIDANLKKDIDQWIEEFQRLKKERNILMHSFAIEGANDRDDRYRVAIWNKKGEFEDIKPLRLEDIRDGFVSLQNFTLIIVRQLLDRKEEIQQKSKN